jgi:hypothetical protein
VIVAEASYVWAIAVLHYMRFVLLVALQRVDRGVGSGVEEQVLLRKISDYLDRIVHHTGHS